MDFRAKHHCIDTERVGVRGFSLGSRIVTQIVAPDDRFKAAADHCSGFGNSGQDVNMTNPTIKEKLTLMRGYENEDDFDRLPQKNELKEMAAKIQCPFLIVAGGDDDISPIEYSYDFFHQLSVAKKLIVYEGHEVRHTCDVDALVADWLKDRLDGKPMQSEYVYVTATGQNINKGF